MPSNSFDLIVIGDDLAGLVAAALCARRGLRTLVLADHERLVGYTLGPHRFATEHQLVAPSGRAAVERVFTELALDHAIRRRTRSARGQVQVVGPDVRFDLAEGGLGRELGRELGGDADRALATWQEAQELAQRAEALWTGDLAYPPLGFWERRRAARATARIARNANTWWSAARQRDPLAAMLWSLPAGLHVPEPSALARAVSLSQWRGVPTLRSGEVRELLLERLISSSGEARPAQVVELEVRWGKVTAVRLASGEELGASHIIAAMPVGDLARTVTGRTASALEATAAQLPLVGWRYVINLAVDAAGVPEGMSSTVLALRDADASFGDANGFLVTLDEVDDAGRVVVTASTVLGVRGDPADPAERDRRLGELRYDLAEAIEEVMPFVASHLVAAHSPHQAVAPEVPGGQAGYEVPRGFPLAPRPVWAGCGDGLAALPYSAGIRNLTFASSQVLPQLGAEGEIIAGFSAAHVACRKLGKRRDYLRGQTVGA